MRDGDLPTCVLIFSLQLETWNRPVLTPDYFGRNFYD